MAEHTSGPWKVRDADSPDVITADGAHAICTTYGVYATRQDKAANARLISAAPEMLAAIENIEAWLSVVQRSRRGGGPFGTSEHLTALRSALAKARESK